MPTTLCVRGTGAWVTAAVCTAAHATRVVVGMAVDEWTSHSRARTQAAAQPIRLRYAVYGAASGPSRASDSSSAVVVEPYSSMASHAQHAGQVVARGVL